MLSKMELKDTIGMMCSLDYKTRFRGEYLQLLIRKTKLEHMCKKWMAGELEFQPTCPRACYDQQLKAMDEYLSVLEYRARVEGVCILDIVVRNNEVFVEEEEDE